MLNLFYILCNLSSFSLGIPPLDINTCITENGKECVFPFYYDGEKVTKCLQAWNDIKPWCATKVDNQGRFISDSSSWEWCSSSCPKSKRWDSNKNINEILWRAILALYSFLFQHIIILNMEMPLSLTNIYFYPFALKWRYIQINWHLRWLHASYPGVELFTEDTDFRRKQAWWFLLKFKTNINFLRGSSINKNTNILILWNLS